ncbi:ATP-dependent helicase ULS1 [Spathaspora sp. JA1]|nr:ATP-dependent helicase ULS1 [Spathaspora sp. JA1]
MTSLLGNIPLIDLSDSDEDEQYLTAPQEPSGLSSSNPSPPSMVPSPISITSVASSTTVTPPLETQIVRRKTSDIREESTAKRARLDSLNVSRNPIARVSLGGQRVVQAKIDPVDVISIESDDEEQERRVVLAKPVQPVQPIVPASADDDDLQILDASAVKIGKFKPSSFEIMQRRQPQPPPPPPPVKLPVQPPQNPLMPTQGLFNQPAPVPHASSSADDMNAIVISQLRHKENEYNVEIDQLETQKHELKTNVQKNRTEFQQLQTELVSQKQRLQNAIVSGNSVAMNNQTGLIARIQKRMYDLQHQMNGFGQLVSPIEYRLSTLRTSLGAILGSLRQRGIETFANHRVDHSHGEVVNQYVSGYTANVYSEDVDIQSLMDNIKPDEDLIEGMEPTPAELNINLLKHQRMGLTWMKRMEESKSKGGILADDMGLGKTVMTLALIVSSKPETSNKITLIIAPVSLLQQWAAEIESKTRLQDRPKIAIYHGIEKKGMSNFNEFKKYDVILTSYGTLSSEWKRHYRESLEDVIDRNFIPTKGGQSYESPFYTSDAKFNRIILDEAQAIKNKMAIASKAVVSLQSKYRFCLSGTPMQNNLDELYPIIRFLRIRPYLNEGKFRADIVNPLKSNRSDKFDRSNSLKKLQAILRSILLRRTKTSLIDGEPILKLPEKIIQSDYIVLDSEESEYYKELEAGIKHRAKRLLSEKTFTSGILTLLLRLRQACCHNYLVRIGEIKSMLRDQNENIKPDWRKMYNMTQELKPNVKQCVIESSSKMLTCPVCFDVVELDSSKMVIFKDCGHLICQTCIEAFFENNTIDEDNSGTRIAKCIECGVKVKESSLIDYILFKAVYVDNLDNFQIQQFCRDYYNVNSRGNAQIIQDLIKEDEGFTPSGKMEKCIELLKNIFTNYPGEKVIIFSQFVTLFDLFKLVLQQQGIEFLRYDGSMNMEHKNDVIKQFYQDSSIKVLLLSLRSGNVGLTLTCASHVIIMDPFWNPYVEEQAMDRAHRIGQQREVHVHRILVEQSVEGRIMELQSMKKELIESALNEKDMKNVSRLGKRELGFLFGLNGLRE